MSSSSSSTEDDNRQSSSSTASLNPDVYRHHTTSHNYFTILQLPNPFVTSTSSTGSATIDELLKQNYLKLVKLHHPDMTKHNTDSTNHSDSSPNGATKFVEIQEAYSVLKDNYTRSIYQAEVNAFIQLRKNPHYNSSANSPYSSSIYPSDRPSQSGFGRMFDGMNGYDTSARQAGKGSRGVQFGTGGFGMFRKGMTSSMLILLPIFGVGFLMLAIVNNNNTSTGGSGSGSSSSNGAISARHQLVEAWLNPQTKRWETPAPWNPSYRDYIQHTPTTKMPRGKVVDSSLGR